MPELSNLGSIQYFETANVEFPASYDYRDFGMVTPAKEQGDCGSSSR